MQGLHIAQTSRQGSQGSLSTSKTHPVLLRADTHAFRDASDGAALLVLGHSPAVSRRLHEAEIFDELLHRVLTSCEASITIVSCTQYVLSQQIGNS